MADTERIPRILALIENLWRDHKSVHLCHILQHIVQYSRQRDLRGVTDEELEAFLSLYRQIGWSGIKIAVSRAELKNSLTNNN